MVYVNGDILGFGSGVQRGTFTNYALDEGATNRLMAINMTKLRWLIMVLLMNIIITGIIIKSPREITKNKLWIYLNKYE